MRVLRVRVSSAKPFRLVDTWGVGEGPGAQVHLNFFFKSYL